MNVSLEEIVEIVTREVIKELLRQGVRVEHKSEAMEVDMSGFKTPILAESTFHKIGPETRELIVPVRTVITPGAREIIKRKNIKVSYKSN